ncbi:cyclin-D-binding Myb-like transcription factor 1 [Trichonephila clavata]|uniref:Cyclin-D-binding Myb-like transcription factor 1 n=1 Tax=Trichonephila clavata TaxID=2740835 RepID=A0A8X6KM09_TRICU|nr:cyclin-D-binding Myb-like transcription factor 1 [Trichonephila clavata]
MDSPEDDNSLQCDSPDEYDSSKRTVVDAEVQLDLHDECKPIEEFDGTFQNNFADINMKLPVAVQNCVPSALQVSSELVVITNAGTGFLNDQKLPISTFQSTDVGESLTKRLCIEQDGQTYILALQDGIDGFSNVVEMQPKNFQSVDTTQLMNFQEPNTLQNKEGINQNWFTSKEEKVTLHNKGHIWKTGMWSKEEVELLENNIQLYCKDHDITNPATIVFEMAKDERKDFYRTIAKGLNRPLFSVYRRVIRMYDNKNHVGKYTTEELEKLKKLRSIYGNDWQAIGAAMGRSASSIKDRCRLMKDNCNQGKWLPAEERRLAEAVYELANALPGDMVSSGLSWAVVAERVGTRSEKQCRTKWLNYLNWKVAGGTDWTREDDITLICRVYSINATDENEVDWTLLSKDWSSVRSPQWLRGKWWNLKRHVPNSNVIPFQEICEYLYQHFVMKFKVKEEVCTPSSDSLANPLELQAIINRPKETILQSVTVPATPPPAMVVTAAAQGFPSPVVSLTNAQCVDVVNSPHPEVPLTSVTVSPVLQTLLPQNIHLTTTPHSFLLTTPAQQTLPITTALSPNQIIIQTMAPETIQRNENITVQMNAPHIIINGSNTSALTSLASTQIPSAPPSPSEVETDALEVAHPHLIVEAYGVQSIDESVTIHQDIETVAQKSNHLISADPMLAANGSPEITNSDTESEKQTSEDHLGHAQN